ncbi:uncharacterized protein LOC121049938 [Rosa chinensis]|nr:uncharacterized protein LOC121049938 [Rosa chinensis]
MGRLLSMKDFEGKAIRPRSSYLDIFLQVASVLQNKKLKQSMEKSTHLKTKMAGIGFKEPISMVGKETYAKGQKFMNSVFESVRKIGGSKRKGFDNFDDHERGFQFKKQKMDMGSTSEAKEPNSSVVKELKVDALYSVGTIKTENSLPRANSIMSCDIKKKSANGDDDKQWGLRPKPKNIKLRKPKKEITTQIIDANGLPEEYKRKIENFDKAKATLVIQKELTKTDLSRTACRLSMPMNQIKPESFLNAEEIKFLAKQNDWPVSVIDPLLEEEDLTLRQWNMEKKTGKTSSSYVLKTRWNEVADKNNLKEKDVVQVWSFRDVGNNLHFAIVLVKKGERKGGEHSSSRGYSQPPSLSTTPRDIVDGERRSGSGQGTESKEEGMIGVNSNVESNSERSTMSNGSNEKHESLSQT